MSTCKTDAKHNLVHHTISPTHCLPSVLLTVIYRVYITQIPVYVISRNPSSNVDATKNKS